MLPKNVEKLIMTMWREGLGGIMVWQEKFVKVCERFYSGMERSVVITQH